MAAVAFTNSGDSGGVLGVTVVTAVVTAEAVESVLSLVVATVWRREWQQRQRAWLKRRSLQTTTA